ASPESITPGRWLWIPGSPPSVAPRNDQAAYDRFRGIAPPSPLAVRSSTSGKRRRNYKKKGKTIETSPLTGGIGLLSAVVAWAQSLGPVAAFALTHGGEHD